MLIGGTSLSFSFLDHVTLCSGSWRSVGYEARLTGAASFSLAHMMGIRNFQEMLSHTEHIISATGMHR